MNPDLFAASIIIAIGFIGSFVPLLPGPPIVWLGACYYAWQTSYADYGWPTLLFMLILALVGSTADLWLSYFGARKSGASPWTSLAAMLGGFVGLMVLSLPGLVIGSLAAIALVEWNRHKDWNRVAKAGAGYLAGYLLSMVVEVVVCVVMIGVFILALRI